MIGSYGKRSKWLVSAIMALLAASIVSFAVTSDSAIDKLKTGNDRFRKAQSEHPNCNLERVKETAQGQSPFAVVLTCSDSRVSPEMIFDRGIGDIFVVRDAGNVSDPIVVGSIEYAVEHLHAPLVVVLGHTKCGAVSAAVADGKAEGGIAAILQRIRPAIKEVKSGSADVKGDELMSAVVRENVANTIAEIKKTSKILSEAEEKGDVEIVGAVYDVSTGKVSWLGK